MFDLPARIEDKFVPEPNSGCWIWTAATYTCGYGIIKIAGTRKNTAAHRLVYEILHGTIPQGLVLDHICRVRCCVNPDHLEPVTHRENILRGSGISARNVRKTTCPKGHPLTEHGSDGWRRCRICGREADARYYARKKAKGDKR